MSRPTPVPEEAQIVDTLLDGRGVARPPGKTVFVDGALAGETVRFARRKKRRNYDEAALLEVLQPAPERVEPRCAVFGICGGCSLQHLDAGRQLAMKESVLLDNLQRIGSVEPARMLAPLAGAPWGYRRKARLGVKYVTKKARVLVGFRERHKSYIADMARCETLHPSIGERLGDIADLIAGLSIRDRLPQIEAAVGDNGTAMVLRVLDAPNDSDIAALAAFGAAHGIAFYLQPKGPDSVTPLPDADAPEPLRYRIDAGAVEIEFAPADFIQVHADVNQQMIARAIELLQPDASSRVLDLFSGLGNFSLPLARRAREVIGVEWSADMVHRAAGNAARNGIGNARFHVADLTEPLATGPIGADGVDRILLDPPRSGAAELIATIVRLAPARIVYVSCHPGTLARDAGQLVEGGDYVLEAAGVMDMFPQTSHVESMALFRRV